MNAFHDVRFPLAISFGATGGPERRNEIVQLVSGREKRNARQALARRHYDAGTGLRSLDDVHEVLAFFEARRGSLHGFRFRDPFDMKSCRPSETPTGHDQTIGTGDGVTERFALMKTYGEGQEAVRRPITHPVADAVLVAVDGVLKETSLDYAVDSETGELVFQPGAVPAVGAVVTAGFVFDVPVRFDIERLSVSLSAFRAGQIPSIPLVEILA
ncbi:phage distal tail protein, Rcc01695 family [Nitratireductor rhodophyticola]